MYRIKVAALALIGGAVLATSCADRAVAPGEMLAPFAISDAQRADLAATLRFAMRDEALSALADRNAVTRISMVAAELTGRVHANDRVGTLRAIRVVRSELQAYRERASSDASALLTIATLSLALDHAELLAAVVPATLYVESNDLD